MRSMANRTYTEQTRLIKLKYQRLFCFIENCTFDMYLAIKREEQKEIYEKHKKT
jgi:hypothetical protein